MYLQHGWEWDDFCRATYKRAAVVVYNPSIRSRVLLSNYPDVGWTDRFPKDGPMTFVMAHSYCHERTYPGPPTRDLLDQLLREASYIPPYVPRDTPMPIQPVTRPFEAPMLDTRYTAPVVAQPTYQAELEKLIGLAGPKAEIERLANFAKVSERRRLVGLPKLSNSFHMVFTGNPGTGKTTIARVIGKVLKDHGILPRGHFVEVDRSALVGQYIGHSEAAITKALKEALGGILFIDEFYALAGSDWDFGKQVIDVLVKFMEDHREEICVIVAGYTEPMKKAIASNPGLKSRFTRTIHFPDYSADELTEIFDAFVKSGEFVLSANAYPYAGSAIKSHQANRGPDFGNARDMRNFYERLTEVQADRVARDNSDLTLVTREDVTTAAGLAGLN